MTGFEVWVKIESQHKDYENIFGCDDKLTGHFGLTR